MAKQTRKKATKKKRLESYDHHDKKRANNPPVGLVTPDTDPDAGQKKTYPYDPHLDPQLVWAGKAEHTSFEVPTVSLHVHERIDPETIIEAVRNKNRRGLFDAREAIDGRRNDLIAKIEQQSRQRGVLITPFAFHRALA